MPIRHVVASGECLSSIAAQYEFRSYEAIYNHPDNLALRQKRPNPNLIYPGDVVIIPDKGDKVLGCSTDRKHVFQAKAGSTYLVLKIMMDNRPVANASYELTVGSQIYVGATDGEGQLKQQIQPQETRGTLRILNPALEWDLAIGDLDPMEEVTGVQQRLTNLGYPCGAADGVVGPLTRGALRQFQAHHNLTPNGQITGATRSKLKSLHDGE